MAGKNELDLTDVEPVYDSKGDLLHQYKAWWCIIIRTVVLASGDWCWISPEMFLFTT